MKKIVYPILLILTSFFITSFLSDDASPLNLVSTKWISPLNDNCFVSLCFNSDSTVMFYNCDSDMYYEIGYAIKGTNIEIEAYGKSSDPTSKMILYEDNGVLRQRQENHNSFPKNFIKVPDASCN
jgi:hypothetical protein